MNRTFVIVFGFALLLQSAITQTAATAQSQTSSRRNHQLREAPISSAESSKDIQVDEPELKPTSDQPPEAEAKQDSEANEDEPELKSVSDRLPEAEAELDWEPYAGEGASPRAVLDLSTTGRIPELTVTDEATTDAGHVTAATVKVVEIKGDQFYHRTLPFEEPLHERFGISHAPALQLPKSALVFFGKSLLLPANLLPRRHRRRDCDSNEGWREAQGRQFSTDCQ